MNDPSMQTEATVWNARYEWFTAVEAGARGEGSYIVSEHASALSLDLMRAFCSGAWVSVIVLAVAVVDAQLRDAELPGFKGKTSRLFKEAGVSDKMSSLLRRRNDLVHCRVGAPAV